MPIKRKPPLTGDSKVSEGAWVIWVGYILPQHTLPAEHLTTREIEATTLFLLVCSEDVVEAVAEKYDAWKDKADCHTYNECKYVARKEHSEPPVFLSLKVQSLCQPAPVGEQNGGVGADCGLHPLIHTLLELNLAQYVESRKKAEPKLRSVLGKNG